MVVAQLVNTLNVTEIFSTKWLILCHVNVTSTEKKENQPTRIPVPLHHL